jgi:hypothetical protein
MIPSSMRRLMMCAVLVLLGATSCASERPPINRVQPDALDKSFFVGKSLSDTSDDPEFYYRPTIVDVDYGASGDELFTASGSQTIARVSFEITEDLLLARLTYQRIAGTTDNGTPDSPNENSGQIVAAFKIESQFDIKRDYNPTTGEELNIIDENTTDSPWYARQYMRVDWSQNLITNAYQLDTLAAVTAFDDAFEYEPVAYSVTDPTDPNAPVFDADNGYFDITNKVFVTPEKLDTPFGSLPACYLSPDFFGGTAPTGNCDPSQVTVRLSFRHVVSDDYEPINWDGNRQAMFGMFTTGTVNPDILGYDRNYGVVDDQWYRFVSRHNIWQQSHYRDATGNVMACYTATTTPVGALPSRDEVTADGSASPDGTDDECEAAGAGSRCDQFSHACTLPYRQRQIKTIPFYFGPDSDVTLFDATAEAVSQWDGALRQAAQAARYTECIRTSGGVTHSVIASCKQTYDPSFDAAQTAIPTVFVLCHNPIVLGDDPACGTITPGTAPLAPRVGDLRYNMIDLIQNPQTASPWGIMVDATDPITGEVVSASVNVWNAVTDLASQSAVDTMRWYLGELSNADVASGNYLKDLVTANARLPQSANSGLPILDDASITARLGALDSRLNDGTKLAAPPLTGGAQALADWAESAVRQKYGNSVLGTGNAGMDSRLISARGSPVESELLTAPYIHLAGLDPAVQPTTVGTTLASPLQGNYAQFLLDFEEQRQNRLGDLGSCLEEAPEPNNMADWANVLNTKFPLADNDPNTPGVQASVADIAARNALWHDYIRRHLTVGLVEHELGHSVGLRHQFTSSFDALNYRPQYWQLRTKNGTVTTACTSATTDGTSCVGPRWYDPITQDERDGFIWRWQQTSVMDYAGDMTQDTLGIGAYDRAAVRMEYADVADVWDDPAATCHPSSGVSLTNPTGGASCSTKGATLHSLLDGFGGLTGPIYVDNSSAFHYSQLNARLNLLGKCTDADISPPANWDATKDGVYSPEFDGSIVAKSTCTGIPTDFVPYRELQPDTGGFVQEPAIGDGVQRNIDALGRVRRPYMFGTDNYADIGNLPVLRNDNGADAYEVTNYLMDEYEDRYLFDDYRRQRTTFSLKNAFMRGLERYNDKLKEVTKGFALYNEIFQGTGEFETFTADDGQLKASALAASLVFDHFARILTRPDSGAHFGDTALNPFGTLILRSTDQLPLVNTASSVSLAIPDGSTGVGTDVAWGGRLLNNSYDTTKGYYEIDYDYNVGSYYDKTLAVDLITDSEDRFVSESRDDFVDGRYRNTSFATLFPDGVRRLLANSLTEDDDIKGWRVASTMGKPNVDGNGALTQPMGFTAWWPKDAPQVCWPAQGRLQCQEFPSGTEIASDTPKESIAVDAEIGFEISKFITFFSMLNLPESWKLNWVDMMRVWQVGTDTLPGFPDSETVAWRDPQSGQLYIAHSYGTEVIDGKTVQRGIAARVLEWMNTLTAKGYSVDTTVVNPTGELTVEKYADNSNCPAGVDYCVGQPAQADAAFAIRVTNYKSVIDYMHQTATQFGFYGPEWRGVY